MKKVLLFLMVSLLFNMAVSGAENHINDPPRYPLEIAMDIDMNMIDLPGVSIVPESPVSAVADVELVFYRGGIVCGAGILEEQFNISCINSTAHKTMMFREMYRPPGSIETGSHLLNSLLIPDDSKTLHYT
jgi:hypothetical protein